MTERLKHDSLAKKILSDPVAAHEFLSHYLPESCKSLLDLNTLKVEKESFVEDNLKQKFSDLVFSIKMKNNQEAFIYTLVEAEVSPKYWTAFKLWKYMFLLLERHKTDHVSKLPLIIPFIIYHGKTQFNRPSANLNTHLHTQEPYAFYAIFRSFFELISLGFVTFFLKNLIKICLIATMLNEHILSQKV